MTSNPNPVDTAQTGSDSLVNRLFLSSLADLRATIIPGTLPTAAPRARLPLEQHTQLLRGEFIGKSELLLYHALLNVQLRRGLDPEASLERFRSLWRDHGDFLLHQLDCRWLVSACDSIADHFPEPEERAAALAASLLVNLIKLHETERRAQGDPSQPPAALAYPWPGRHDLFDGLTAYRIGRGDMIRNLQERVQRVSASVVFAGPILRELLRRMNGNDTVLKRCRDVHANPATLWPC